MSNDDLVPISEGVDAPGVVVQFPGAPAIVRSAREQWEEERADAVGASEVPAILGVDERIGQFGLYARKIRALAGAVETPVMKWGHRLERVVAEVYQEETGRPTTPAGLVFRRHPSLRFLGATLDFETSGCVKTPAPVTSSSGARPPLEAKAVGFYNAHLWETEAPLQYQIQVQIQMACTGAEWASIAALMGWPPKPVWYDVLRNDRFLAAAYPRIEEFFLRVQRRDPPPLDQTPATHDAIRALWADESGATIELSQDLVPLVERWELAKETRNAHDKEAEHLGDELRAVMRDATIGLLPDGTSLTLKTTARAGYTVEPTSFRTLRRFVPKALKRRQAK